MNSNRKRSLDVHDLPSILDGTFFKVTKLNDDGSVEAECTKCDPAVRAKKPTWKGFLRPTSNFVSHLKVSLIFLAFFY